jgi:hypothetical protein
VWIVSQRGKIKVVDQPPHLSRIIQGLPLEEEIRNNYPSALLRHRLDQSIDFVPTGPVEISTTDA